MSAKENKNTKGAENQQLEPIFGVFCRTQAFGLHNKPVGEKHIAHYEAFLDDPIRKTWTVQQVTQVTRKYPPIWREKTNTKVQKLKAGLPFTTALQDLIDFEQANNDRPQLFTPVYPDPQTMGMAHYKAFAEREGYIFDTKGKAQPRPHLKALPSDAEFSEEDLKTAAQNLRRPEDEFDNNGPASKIPNVHFLFDQFNRAAKRPELTEMRMLNVMDRMVDQITHAHDNMQEYCKTYTELGQGVLIDAAEKSLVAAEASVRQLKAYGVETTAFESFVQQCQITCHILHAEGLYDLMSRNKGDFDLNDQIFQERVTKAMDGFRRIDASDSGMATLQRMITQTPQPAVPESIGKFIANYRQKRDPYSMPGTSKPWPPYRP